MCSRSGYDLDLKDWKKTRYIPHDLLQRTLSQITVPQCRDIFFFFFSFLQHSQQMLLSCCLPGSRFGCFKTCYHKATTENLVSPIHFGVIITLLCLIIFICLCSLHCFSGSCEEKAGLIVIQDTDKNSINKLPSVSKQRKVQS